MKFKVKIAGFLSIFIFSSAVNAKDQAIIMKPWFDVTNEMISETAKIKNECKKLELSEEAKKSYKPLFPPKAFRKRIQGYAIFEFKIDAQGQSLLAKTVAKSDKIFEQQAKGSFEKLRFVVADDWNTTCADQIYRIGYAFRVLTDCTGTEFPKPIINVCSVGMMVNMSTGRPANIKFEEK